MIFQTVDNQVIRKLFPDSVICDAQPIADYLEKLLPAERDQINDCSDKRKREFSTGRWCARQALAAINITDFAILSGKDREPIWPEEIVGSISHCKDMCGVVIANKSDISSIGFDIENIKELKNDIGRIVCTKEEKNWLNDQTRYPYNILLLLLFSLKESIYKCVYQYNKIKLGFKDLSLIPQLDSSTVNLILHNVDFGRIIKLNYLVKKDHIITGAIIDK